MTTRIAYARGYASTYLALHKELEDISDKIGKLPETQRYLSIRLKLKRIKNQFPLAETGSSMYHGRCEEAGCKETYSSVLHSKTHYRLSCYCEKHAKNYLALFKQEIESLKLEYRRLMR